MKEFLNEFFFFWENYNSLIEESKKIQQTSKLLLMKHFTCLEFNYGHFVSETSHDIFYFGRNYMYSSIRGNPTWVE